MSDIVVANDDLDAAVKAKAEELIVSKTTEEMRKVIREELAKAIKVDPKDRPITDNVKDLSDDDPKGGFKSFGEFAHTIWKAGPSGVGADKRLVVLKTAGLQEEGADAQGGYLVPTEYRAQLLQKSEAQAQIWNRTQLIPMGSNAIQLPAVNETSRGSGSRYGGVTLYWIKEAAQKTQGGPTFAKVELRLKKLTGLCYVTDELLEDSAISIEPLIMDLFSKEFAFVLDDSVVNGTGVAQPLGILNAACLVSVSGETGQATDTLVPENIVKMMARLHAGSWSNAVWLVNQDVFPQLWLLNKPIGTGGGLVFMPAGGLSVAPYPTILGRPVLVAEQVPSIGDAGCVMLVDLSQYLRGQKSGGLQVATSIHLKFDYDETAFRFVFRVDGQPWWSAALTPYKGTSNTVSPFVALAAI